MNEPISIPGDWNCTHTTYVQGCLACRQARSAAPDHAEPTTGATQPALIDFDHLHRAMQRDHPLLPTSDHRLINVTLSSPDD